MNIQTISDKANGHGLWVNNLFQKRDGYWQANMHDGKTGYSYAVATDPIEALQLCLEQALKEKKIPPKIITSLDDLF